MKSIKLIFSFLAGATIGSAATWYFLKEGYSRMAQEEIDSVKERYGPKPIINFNQEEQNKLSDIIKDNGYSSKDSIDYNALSKKGVVKETDISEPAKERESDITYDQPYTIPPEEFGEYACYEKISLTHYADGVLTDLHDNVIDNLDETVGSDYATHFGEYEDDSVFIRNDSKKCDYEILFSEKTYSELVEEKPYLNMEV